jgi:hypothetical protein
MASEVPSAAAAHGVFPKIFGKFNKLSKLSTKNRLPSQINLSTAT